MLVRFGRVFSGDAFQLSFLPCLFQAQIFADSHLFFIPLLPGGR